MIEPVIRHLQVNDAELQGQIQMEISKLYEFFKGLYDQVMSDSSVTDSTLTLSLCPLYRFHRHFHRFHLKGSAGDQFTAVSATGQ